MLCSHRTQSITFLAGIVVIIARVMRETLELCHLIRIIHIARREFTSICIFALTFDVFLLV